MTTPVPPEVPDVTGYASIEDYELRTGITVPPENEAMVQTWLNDVSALINVYLGDCQESVAAMFPDVLTSLTVTRTNRLITTPAGVTSASAGGTSVSYDREATTGWLSPVETDLLDRLMDSACGAPPTGVSGLGELGVGWGGPPGPDDDVDELWVVSVPPRSSRRRWVP